MAIYELGNWSIVTTNLVVMLDFSAPGEGRNNFLFFASHPVYAALLQ